MGMGISRTISISNTRKITANRKNRMENGIRADRNGSNPHSNGDSFSRLFVNDRILVKIDSENTKGGRTKATIEDIIINFISLLEI